MKTLNTTYHQESKAEATFYHLSTGETIEEPKTRFELHDNYCDATKTFIEIEFYLPETANAKLILMDSNKIDTINLIDKDLKAGRHIYRSRIKTSELKHYKYYYKLDAYGYNEVKEMHLTC
jgi:hypothetical protein